MTDVKKMLVNIKEELTSTFLVDELIIKPAHWNVFFFFMLFCIFAIQAN